MPTQLEIDAVQSGIRAIRLGMGCPKHSASVLYIKDGESNQYLPVVFIKPKVPKHHQGSGGKAPTLKDCYLSLRFGNNDEKLVITEIPTLPTKPSVGSFTYKGDVYHFNTMGSFSLMMD